VKDSTGTHALFGKIVEDFRCNVTAFSFVVLKAIKYMFVKYSYTFKMGLASKK